jgi:hypothetical protein
VASLKRDKLVVFDYLRASDIWNDKRGSFGESYPIRQLSSHVNQCFVYFTAIPLPDPKSQPEIYFFDVVGQANTLFHLFEKQFQDNLIPLVL